MDTQTSIRDAITRQTVSQRWLAVAPAVLMAGIGLLVATLRIRSLHGLPVALVVALALTMMVLLGLGVLIFVARRARSAQCPKCGAPLSVVAYLMKHTPRLKKINFCPYCAANLDDPRPEAPAPVASVTTPDKLVWK